MKLQTGQRWRLDDGTIIDVGKLSGRGRNRAAWCQVSPPDDPIGWAGWLSYRQITKGQLIDEEAKP